MSATLSGLERPSPFGRPAFGLLWLLGFAVFFAWMSYRLGGDGTPDFRAYHFYNGFAAVTGPRSGDIAAAQLQTYFFPALDAAYYYAFLGLNEHPGLLRALLGLPYAAAAWAVFWTSQKVLPPAWPARIPLSALLAVFGVTGAAGFATIGTTMSEIVPGLPALFAIPLWLDRRERGQARRGALAAGALCGLSLGLKLTFAPLFGAMVAAIFLGELPRIGPALRLALLFLLIGVGVTMAVAGWWWLHNFQTLGNPVFPAFNDVFRSDLVDHGRWSDDRFKPRHWLMAIVYPAYWAFRPSHLAIELDMRDPRMLIGLASALLVLLALALGRVRTSFPSGHAARFVATAFLLAYGAWELQFSIYRYLAVVECFTGVLAVAALSAWTSNRRSMAVGTLALVVGLAAAASWTRYPWWDRSLPASRAVDVSAPPIAPDSMVLFLDPYAFSYVVPFLPPSARIIGANTNLVRPGSWGLLQKRIEETVRLHNGPVWGFEDPQDFPGIADTTLAHYGLKRSDDCAWIRTNIEPERIRACLLKREP